MEGVNKKKSREYSSACSAYRVGGEQFGPDEDEIWAQLFGGALEQLEHVGEDAHRERLRARATENAVLLEDAQREQSRKRKLTSSTRYTVHTVPARWPRRRNRGSDTGTPVRVCAASCSAAPAHTIQLFVSTVEARSASLEPT